MSTVYGEDLARSPKAIPSAETIIDSLSQLAHETGPSLSPGTTIGQDPRDKDFLQQLKKDPAAYDPSEVARSVTQRMNIQGDLVLIEKGSQGRYIIEASVPEAASKVILKVAKTADQIDSNLRQIWLAQTYESFGKHPTTMLAYQEDGLWEMEVSAQSRILRNKLLAGGNYPEKVRQMIQEFMKTNVLDEPLVIYPNADGSRIISLNNGDARKKLKTDLIRLARYLNISSESSDVKNEARTLVQSLYSNADSLLYPTTPLTLGLGDLKLEHMVSWKIPDKLKTPDEIAREEETGSSKQVTLVYDVGPDVFGCKLQSIANKDNSFKGHLEEFISGKPLPLEASTLLGEYKLSSTESFDASFFNVLPSVAEMMYSAIKDTQIDKMNFVDPMMNELKRAETEHELFNVNLMNFAPPGNGERAARISKEVAQWVNYGFFVAAIRDAIFSDSRVKLNQARSALDAMMSGGYIYIPPRE